MHTGTKHTIETILIQPAGASSIIHQHFNPIMGHNDTEPFLPSSISVLIYGILGSLGQVMP